MTFIYQLSEKIHKSAFETFFSIWKTEILPLFRKWAHCYKTFEELNPNQYDCELIMALKVDWQSPHGKISLSVSGFADFASIS